MNQECSKKATRTFTKFYIGIVDLVPLSNGKSILETFAARTNRECSEKAAKTFTNFYIGIIYF
jgi:hypothetical protein